MDNGDDNDQGGSAGGGYTIRGRSRSFRSDVSSELSGPENNYLFQDQPKSLDENRYLKTQQDGGCTEWKNSAKTLEDVTAGES